MAQSPCLYSIDKLSAVPDVFIMRRIGDWHPPIKKHFGANEVLFYSIFKKLVVGLYIGFTLTAAGPF
jgi:hypothetical protein